MKRMFRLGNFVNDIPLKTKFFLFLSLVYSPILVVNLIFMDRMSELIREREEQNLDISMERARKDIHNFIDGGVAVSHALSTDKTLYEMLDREYESQLDFYETFDERSGIG